VVNSMNFLDLVLYRLRCFRLLRIMSLLIEQHQVRRCVRPFILIWIGRAGRRQSICTNSNADIV
jgi:hypothetical protein